MSEREMTPMILYGTCGHEFNWPNDKVHPESLKCAACGRLVAVWAVDIKTAPVSAALNHGENRYRQTVLGQKALHGYPTVTRSASNE